MEFSFKQGRMNGARCFGSELAIKEAWKSKQLTIEVRLQRLPMSGVSSSALRNGEFSVDLTSPQTRPYRILRGGTSSPLLHPRSSQASSVLFLTLWSETVAVSSPAGTILSTLGTLSPFSADTWQRIIQKCLSQYRTGPVAALGPLDDEPSVDLLMMMSWWRCLFCKMVTKMLLMTMMASMPMAVLESKQGFIILSVWQPRSWISNFLMSGVFAQKPSPIPVIIIIVKINHHHCHCHYIGWLSQPLIIHNLEFNNTCLMAMIIYDNDKLSRRYHCRPFELIIDTILQ